MPPPDAAKRCAAAHMPDVVMRHVGTNRRMSVPYADALTQQQRAERVTTRKARQFAPAYAAQRRRKAVRAAPAPLIAPVPRARRAAERLMPARRCRAFLLMPTLKPPSAAAELAQSASRRYFRPATVERVTCCRAIMMLCR